MSARKLICRLTQLQDKDVVQVRKSNRHQTWPYVCAWWTGRHHPGLSPGSHGLSSITVPLFPCQTVTCPAWSVIIAKSQASKSLFLLLFHKAHPKKSVRGKTLSSPRTKLQREVTQTTVGNLYSLIRRHRMSRRTRCHYPDTNLTKPTIPCSRCQPTIFPPCNTAKSSFSVQEVRSLASYRITSNLLCWAMHEQLYEGGWVKDVSSLIGWPAMVCVWEGPFGRLTKNGYAR